MAAKIHESCVVVFVLVFALLIVFLPRARAQDEDMHELHMHHHEGMSPAVDKFYSTWFKPDNPTKSCCNKSDCEGRTRRGADDQPPPGFPAGRPRNACAAVRESRSRSGLPLDHR
jgi:hypothetical protein